MASRKDSKGRSLHTGESQRKNGYMYRYMDVTGKRQTIYAADLPELREKEKQTKRDVDENILTDHAIRNMTVNELFQRYMQTRELAEPTRANYIKMWDHHVRDEIGNVRVTQLRPSYIRAFYVKLSRLDYSHSTIKLIHTILSPTLEMAVDDDMIRKNPAKHAFTSELGEKAKEKAAKAKAAEAEKQRVAKEKAKEKERLAKEKAKQKEAAAKAARAEKDRIAKEKAKQKEAEAKAAQAEKDRIAREKAKEKAVAAKAAEAEKQRIAKEKAKEKEKAAREKAKAKEKERIAKMRAAEAEKQRIAKEKAKEKERIAREKIKEQERAAKEKAKEKERIAREKARAKAKEQERLARERAKAKEAKLKADKVAKNG